MGNGQTTARVDTKTRKERNQVRGQKMQENMERVDRYTTERLQDRNRQIATPETLRETQMLLHIREQAQRGDRPLTKTDLVAILIRLQPVRLRTEDATKIYQELTSRDLIILIREILYVPSPDEASIPALPVSTMLVPTSRHLS